MRTVAWRVFRLSLGAREHTADRCSNNGNGMRSNAVDAINLKRVYETVSNDEGVRMLVDRVWPRGLSKDRAKIDLWPRDVAPSNELRRWFSHEPEKWAEFRRRYFAALTDTVPAATRDWKTVEALCGMVA